MYGTLTGSAGKDENDPDPRLPPIPKGQRGTIRMTRRVELHASVSHCLPFSTARRGRRHQIRGLVHCPQTIDSGALLRGQDQGELDRT